MRVPVETQKETALGPRVVEPEVAPDIDNRGHNVSLVRLLQVDHEHTDMDSEGITDVQRVDVTLLLT
jgi:hypothetical protein